MLAAATAISLARIELDAKRQANALDRDDDRLGDGFAADLPRVDATVWHDIQAIRSDARSDIREVESAREVLAVCVDEATAQLRIALEFAIGERQLL